MARSSVDGSQKSMLSGTTQLFGYPIVRLGQYRDGCRSEWPTPFSQAFNCNQIASCAPEGGQTHRAAEAPLDRVRPALFACFSNSRTAFR